MAIEDKIKWDEKYTKTPKLLENRDPSEKLVNIVKKVDNKKALEIACGSGRNSIFLAKQGYIVDALDISEVALETLNNKNIPNINAQLVDLDHYTVAKNSYDMIVMTNFLDRKLISQLKDALKKDGILFIETYMEDKENEKQNANPNFLLKKGELKSFFDVGFEILNYDEFFNETYELYRMKKQSICVKKII